MKTLEEYIAYYGETWGKIFFNDANASINDCCIGNEDLD